MFTLPPAVKTSSSSREVDPPADSPACLRFNVENMQQEKRHSLLSPSPVYHITERVLTHQTHCLLGNLTHSLKRQNNKTIFSKDF